MKIEIKKIFSWCWEKIGFFWLFLLVGLIIFSGWLFFFFLYKPLYYPQAISMPSEEVELKVDQEKFQTITQELKKRQQEKEKILEQSYPDLFSAP